MADIDFSSVPTNYTITMKDMDFIDVRMAGDQNQPIKLAPITANVNAKMTGDPKEPITTQIQGGDKPIATTFELLNIPRLSLDDIKDLMTPKLRIEMPNYEQLCFSLFGIEIFKLCLSGEFQTITQEYVPNRFERCDIDCPELDTRPFPKETKTHKGQVK